MSSTSAAESATKTQKRDPERTRTQILNAAIVEFAEKGLRGARVDEIADRSGVNKRMIYHYFGGKDDLYLAVLEQTYKDIREHELELSLDHFGAVDGMRELLSYTWQHFHMNPHFVSLLNNENMNKARHLKRSRKVTKMHSPLIAMLEDLLRRGAAEGVFRAGVDPVQLYISIAGLCYFYHSNIHTLSTIFSRSLSKKPELDARLNHVIDVVLGYLRP